jgi:hypothetical protein
VRLRSVIDLLDKAEYIAGLAGKETPVAQARELVKSLSADKKGIEGVDPKKPFGAYAVLEKEVEASPLVLMIPIADEKQFLSALETRGEHHPEKGDHGTQKIAVPLVGEATCGSPTGTCTCRRRPRISTRRGC